MTDYTVAVLEDAIRILELLKGQSRGLSLAELTEASGFIKNKVFRILFTLDKHRLVERDTDGQYWLGLGLSELGQHVHKQTILVEACEPVLDRLARETGESIFVGVVSGSDALCIAARESPKSIRLFAEVGRRAPLHSGGVPKVLLAHMPDKQRCALIEEFTRDPGMDGVTIEPARLEETLAIVRQQGYAVIADELDFGAHSVAAPIRDHQGRVIAAISIAGPSHRFPEETIERYIQLITNASLEISRTFGYQP